MGFDQWSRIARVMVIIAVIFAIVTGMALVDNDLRGAVTGASPTAAGLACWRLALWRRDR